MITEGKDLEECRDLMRDALSERLRAYRELGQDVPVGTSILETLVADFDDVRQTA